MADVRPPVLLTNERDTLLAFLDYLRESVLRKLEGVSPSDAARLVLPSGTSLLGLVEHLTGVEAGWVHYAFADLPEPAQPAPDDSARLVTAVAAYRQAARRTDSVVGGCKDLQTLGKHAFGNPEPSTLRWILVHLVEETARHAGHADAVRELLDGTTGR